MFGRSRHENKKRHDPFAALRIKDFRSFIAARFVITIAVQMQEVVVAWKIYELTKDVLSLGLIGLAEAIPALSVALFAGHIADIYDRRKISLITVSFLFLCSIGLFLIDRAHLGSTVALMYGIIFLTGIARGFIAPAFFSLLSQLVPKEIYSNSSTWNSSSWQIGAVAGPAIGGVLYGILGSSATLMLVICMMGIAVYCVYKVKSHGVPKRKEENIIESLKAGISFVFKSPIILGALSLDLFAVLFGGAVMLLPVFAKDILLIGPEGLGYLRAAPSLGAFITMIGMAYRPPVHKAGRNLLFAVAGFGLCIIGFGLSRNFYLSFVLLLFSGAFDSVSVIIRSVVLQVETPDHMRGRVSSVNTMFIGSSNEIGGFESGLMAKLMGTVPSVVFGGCMTLLVVTIATFSSISLRNLSLKDVR